MLCRRYATLAESSTATLALKVAALILKRQDYFFSNPAKWPVEKAICRL